MVHIPPIHFPTHLLLSIPPVCYIYLLLADYYPNTVETTQATVSRLVAVYHSASPYYIITVACLLPCLGLFYTLIIGTEAPLLQRSIVHFTLCFWVLSELELYKAYINSKKLYW